MQKIELGKLRMQGRKVKEASIEASNKKDAATKEHVAAQKAAKAVVMEARKVICHCYSLSLSLYEVATIIQVGNWVTFV